ncbi:hypothetical protein NGRA_3325 [Nosema granulosis]|uniref:Uncharacterized protein n=1 Tax=Nosema granulosis TaxID=83296 RepID=A0A9P6KXS8_9MICR|nr:hypothetical protein NGRA_3325 [Nosema granulosis]
MVEKYDKELDRSTKTYKVTAGNITNDIFRLEMEDDWIESKDSGKVRFVLKNSDDKIIEWHKENFSNKREESLKYDEWKGKLLDFFAKTISPEEFIREKQLYSEEPMEFLRRLRKDGRVLFLGDNMILGVFKQGLTRNRDFIKLALVGQTRISEGTFKIISEANKIAEDSFNLKKRREK